MGHNQAETDETSNAVIKSRLNGLLEAIENGFKANALTLQGGLARGVDDLVRNAIEAMPEKRKRLLVILETKGGSIDVAERIATTFRHHYDEVDFLIPNSAYSAGTILTMSGDNIYMDYYSVLGPIDPQVNKQGVGWVPALGYLQKYEEIIAKSANGTITDAEMAFLCQRFDPGELHAFEQAKEQSITLLKQWLVQYKFKDWTVTETKRATVTPEMKQQRAEEIAETLNKTELWHSHSRGIPMRTLRDVLKLKIEDLASRSDLYGEVRAYDKLLRDFLIRMGHDGILHTLHEFTPYTA